MIKPIPPLSTVITPFPYHIDSQASLSEAKAIMAERSIRHLVVKTDGDISGLLSERDLQLKHTDEELVVDDVCTPNPTVADIHDPLNKVLEVMVEKQLGSIIALREGELVGIFTTTDACREFARYLKMGEKYREPDDLIA